MTAVQSGTSFLYNASIVRCRIILGMVLIISSAGAVIPEGEHQGEAVRVFSRPSITERSIIDAHCHFVDCAQDSDGMDALLTAMDAANVSHCVIFGLPVVVRQDSRGNNQPGYADSAKAYITDLRLARAVDALKPGQRERCLPFICGFNPTDPNAVGHIRRMLAWYPGLWRGIGEILTRHDQLDPTAGTEEARANHPALDPVYVFAASNGMPVWIHSNAGRAGSDEPVYYNELRDAVERHPGTRFVWCHGGYSREAPIADITTMLDDLLSTCPNVWIDLSWTVYDDCVAPDGIPDEEWVALIERYSDRFLIGSDVTGRFDGYADEIRKYDALLRELSADAAERIGSGNLWDVLSTDSIQ